jgi:hypothetical protein
MHEQYQPRNLGGSRRTQTATMLRGFRGFPHFFHALLPGLKLRRYRTLPHTAQIITHTQLTTLRYTV